jgi:hypothetical protein
VIQSLDGWRKNASTQRRRDAKVQRDFFAKRAHSAIAMGVADMSPNGQNRTQMTRISVYPRHLRPILVVISVADMSPKKKRVCSKLVTQRVL